MTIGEALQKYSEYLGLDGGNAVAKLVDRAWTPVRCFSGKSSYPKDNNDPSDPESFGTGPYPLAPSVQLGEVA